jgi:hypothetical protein
MTLGIFGHVGAVARSWRVPPRREVRRIQGSEGEGKEGLCKRKHLVLYVRTMDDRRARFLRERICPAVVPRAKSTAATAR